MQGGRETGGHVQPGETVIDAGRRDPRYWSEIWRYRELLYFLARRDISVRYRQTALGVIWVLLRPLLTAVVFTIVFGRLAGLSHGTVPYSLLVLAGMLPWQLCSGALVDSGNSLVNNGSLISKVYFPRLIIPLSALLTNLVDFLIASLLFVILMAWHDVTFHWQAVLLPLFLLLSLAAAFGIGLWVAALNVRYRDFRIVAGFIVQLGLYLSPVGFSSAVIPAEWRLVYSLNPMVGIIDGFRWALFGDASPMYWPGLALSVIVTIVLLGTALAHFRASEMSFADEI